jgi:hypothetical protein
MILYYIYNIQIVMPIKIKIIVMRAIYLKKISFGHFLILPRPLNRINKDSFINVIEFIHVSSHASLNPLNIVAVSGGLNTPSKTEALVQEILNELGEATPINVHFIKFSGIGHLLGCDLSQSITQRVQDDLAKLKLRTHSLWVLLFIASFTGLFKHFFDFVEQTALVDVPVLLAASGGSDRHALVRTSVTSLV